MGSFFDRFLIRKVTSARAKVVDLRGQAKSAMAAREFERALDLCDQVLAIDSLDAEAFYTRGNGLRNLGRFDAAIESYNRTIELKPDHAYAYCNRGVVQQSLGLISEALASYDLAILHDSHDAMSHYNRALLLQDCARWDEALQSYDRAIAIDPTFADAQYNRSLALLYCEDFERGWRAYEWRWKNAQRLGMGAPRGFSQPLWLGVESIAGKRVLLHSEGGLGDTIQFCRYAKLVADRGAIVLMEVQGALVDLLSTLEGVSSVTARGNPLPEFDYHCPLMSLPLACKTALGAVPAPARGLKRDLSNILRWRVLQQEQAQTRVGLAWSGNPNNPIDQRRSIRLADLVAHLPAHIKYFRLQKDVREEDQATLQKNPLIVSPDKDFQDFVHIAALCDRMDLVISVDTSLAHLSATLGMRTWLLLPFSHDWRWMRNRDDTPWYPSMTLFRQTSSGDWCGVFERIGASLRREFPTD